MTGLINAGYEYTIGDVEVNYYINNLMPKISILDYLLGDTNSLIPGDLSQSTLANIDAGIYPFGYDWNTDYPWVKDPYLKFNLGEWINQNTDLDLIF